MASHFTALNVGGGSDISKVSKSVVSVNPASLAANTSADTSVTVAGAVVGDCVIVNPPALTTGLIVGSARVSAANTVSIRILNATAGVIDEPAGNWVITLVSG